MAELVGRWEEGFVIPNTDNYRRERIEIELGVEAGDTKDLATVTQLNLSVVKSTQQVSLHYHSAGDEGELDYHQDPPIIKVFPLNINLLSREKECLNHLLACLQPLITEKIADQRLLDMIRNNNLATKIRDYAEYSLRHESNKCISFIINVEICTQEVMPVNDDDNFMDDDDDDFMDDDDIIDDTQRNHGIGLLTPTSPSAVAKIIDTETDNNEMFECGICLEDSEEKVVSMPCKHMYHTHCILPWLEVKDTCPLCRYQLKIVSRTNQVLNHSMRGTAAQP